MNNAFNAVTFYSAGATGWTSIANFIQSTPAAGEKAYVIIGAADTANNSGVFGFHNAGTGLATNYAHMSVAGQTTPPLVVTGAGRVGIKTSTPSEALSVSGNISLTGSIYGSGGTISTSGISVTNNVVAGWLTGDYVALQKRDTIFKPTAGVYFADETSALNQMLFSGGPNGFTFWTTNSGASELYSRANISLSGLYTQISDSNLKKPVGYLSSSDSLDVITKLKPCYFSFKNDESGTIQSGFYAQDVQALIPEIVTQLGDSLGLSYSGFAPYLVSAMQELQNQVALLQSQVAALQLQLPSN